MIKIAEKIDTFRMEMELSKFFNRHQNIIVPNVYWGLNFKYEIDLLVLSQSLYATEIEIKISKSDIKQDLNKSCYAHKSNRIKKFFYAVPDYLENCKYLPTDCGLIVVKKINHLRYKCIIKRAPRLNKNARKFTESEYIKLLKLSYHRMWCAKESFYRIKHENKNSKENIILQ